MTKKRLCKDCLNILKTSKPWREAIIPQYAEVQYLECKKDSIGYVIRKDMLFTTRLL